MADREATAAIVEASEVGLSQGRLDYVDFDLVIHTNLAYGDYAAIRDQKVSAPPPASVAGAVAATDENDGEEEDLYFECGVARRRLVVRKRWDAAVASLLLLLLPDVASFPPQRAQRSAYGLRASSATHSDRFAGGPACVALASLAVLFTRASGTAQRRGPARACGMVGLTADLFTLSQRRC